MSEALNGVDVSYNDVAVHLKLKTVEDMSCISPWLIQDLGITSNLSDITRKSLNELYENCILLDSVDPGNKCKYAISVGPICC